MSTEFWILLGVPIVGFILTWIICSKPVSESDWKDLESTPMAIMPLPYDYEKEELKRKNYCLEKELRYRLSENEQLRFKLYGGWDIDALRKLLERPVEVNIENIVKVNVEKTS